jgi:hypothetical protein
MILYQGDVRGKMENNDNKNYMGNDDFFNTNYDKRFPQLAKGEEVDY